ncbi:hypothetical protein P175DRAFT_0529505 [Aspergillus ochraceoroseus IBT 24754]|uniref:Uncharacterized protein n=1 Tax=Aspergillus ochraceoroseus IBT 24754 TaxID=1392256 RepID=A0A2T5M1P2_9EURO|nr:uncharacterized protein P175DRAFT_0529505 [Aspergillus ochraceoroseus IBT 24754]PTU22449.1 hypothetical protein P175DRAFT_0529505 [Aspergillus ochraceoroseus IBT 24754]
MSPDPTLHPKPITPGKPFSALLAACYPETSREQPLAEKLLRKPPGQQRRRQTRTHRGGGGFSTCSSGAESQVREFLALDRYRKHGIFRPALMGMVKANQDSVVRKTTGAAAAAGAGAFWLDCSSETSTPTSTQNQTRKTPIETLIPPPPPPPSRRRPRNRLANPIRSLACNPVLQRRHLSVALSGEVSGPKKKKGGKGSSVLKANGALNVKSSLSEDRGGEDTSGKRKLEDESEDRMKKRRGRA